MSANSSNLLSTLQRDGGTVGFPHGFPFHKGPTGATETASCGGNVPYWNCPAIYLLWFFLDTVKISTMVFRNLHFWYGISVPRTGVQNEFKKQYFLTLKISCTWNLYWRHSYVFFLSKFLKVSRIEIVLASTPHRDTRFCPFELMETYCSFCHTNTSLSSSQYCHAFNSTKKY